MPAEIRRAHVVEALERLPCRRQDEGRSGAGPPSRAAARARGRHVQARDAPRLHLARLERLQQLGKGHLPLAEHREIHRRRPQHPGIVGGDLRAPHQDAQPGLPGAERRRQVQGALHVPQVTGEPHQPGVAAENRLHQALVPEPVGEHGGQDLDVVGGLEAAPARVQVQVAGRERHVAARRLDAQLRDRQLHEQHPPAGRGHGCGVPLWHPRDA